MTRQPMAPGPRPTTPAGDAPGKDAGPAGLEAFGAFRAFAVSPVPRIAFGAGRIAEVPSIARAFGERALVVTGARSFRDSHAWGRLTAGLDGEGLEWDVLAVAGEPSPDLVDAAVAVRRDGPPDVVVGIGGGSVLDAAKAIAGLLRTGTSAYDHLEGIGRRIPYPGPATPFVAVPTTAGTGSEATRNAVLSGGGGHDEPPPFKKSFRDERLVARVAVLDPDLLAGCPPQLIAGDGMDAVTQLIEALTSSGANPFTDAVARAGLSAARDSLLAWHESARAGAPAATTTDARARMAFAALCSGIALANAGLGAVHGIVAALGARFPVPHGTGCGILLAATTRANLAAMAGRATESAGLARYAEAGRILAGDPALGDGQARMVLADTLDAWTSSLALPRLRDLGVRPTDVPALVAESRGSSMRTNPVVLTDAEIESILAACI